MKPITRNISRQDLIVFAALFILSLIIWVAGPHMIFANHFSLVEPEKRFGVIMVLFLGWLLLKLIFAVPTPVKSTTPPAANPETMKKLRALQNRFTGAMGFLKKTFVNKYGQKINLSHLPWYAFIGPNQSGKTTLLANANINYILSKQFKPEILKSLPASEGCDWWVTRDLVMIDIPSVYIQSTEKTHKNAPRASVYNVLWYNLLNLIHTHREHHSLNGIVIALHIPELMKLNHNQQQKTFVADIRQRLIELREKFGKHLPCYLIITKCDLLPGFQEFFSESSSDELAQVWGVTLPSLQGSDKLIDVLSNRLNSLIKRLNKQLIWRLHQERNPQARSLIKDFPLQVERIKEAILYFIKAVSLPDLCLNGVFLTSVIQPDTEESSADTTLTINQIHQHALQILQPAALPSKNYFVRQLISQGLLHTHEEAIPQAISKPIIWERRAIYVIATAIIIASGIFLSHDFRQGLQQAYAIQNDLTQYQIYMQQGNQDGDHLIKVLPLLNALQEAAVNSTHKLTRLSYLAFYSNRSQQTATELYGKALQTIVLPEIKNDFEKYLQDTNNKNPTELYAVLQAYLMLGDAEHLQVDFVANTIKQILPVSIDAKTADQLTNHINATFAFNKAPLTLDTTLIEQARKQLTNLSAADLAYLILKNMGDNNLVSSIKLGTDTDHGLVFVTKGLENQIPNMFTANGFQTILSGEITEAATEAASGNWIIGAPAAPSNSAQLAEQLRTQYISNYIDIWESQLANIKLYSPQNLTELNNMLALITSNNSPLLQMLQTIQHNTAFDAIMNASPKLQALNALLTNANNNQDNMLYQMFVNLQQLHLYIQGITNNNDVGNAIFQAAKQHLQANANDPLTNINALADRTPEPMKTWLTNISAQSWKLISENTAHYIDISWQKSVMPIYHNEIANHFPFVRNASQEVNLQAFVGFLGQQGMFNNFYQTYLKPFIDDSGEEWHWVNMNNQRMPFKDDVLTDLQNVLKIQRAFFPNGDNQLYVQFTLQPVSLAADIKRFNITINGQQINYQTNDPTTPRVISWPGNDNTSHATSLNFINASNQLSTDTVRGDWAWFKLVDKATQNVNSRKEIELTFNLDGHTAKYLLFTQGHLNPFLPLNLERVQLPDTLLSS